MFGFVQANLADLSQEEKERYQGAYCGLCKTIGQRHGHIARLGLSYDLTFLSLLLHYSQVFSTAAPYQRSVEIHVLQGERPMARDNKTIGKFKLDGIKKAPAGVPQIEVTFDIDVNGILKVSAKDLDTGKAQSITITANEKMSDAEIEQAIRDEEYILEHGRAPVNSIKSRLKTLPSLREKLERKNIPFDVDTMEEQLNDIAGVRVICSFPEDVYTMANAFLAMDDIEVLQEKDYIKNPKPNGYRSLHLIVAIPVHLAGGKRMTKVEIQLRTIAMDFWASLEHQLRYKQDNEFTEEMATELYACAQLSAALDLRMDKLRKSVQEHNSREELL